MAARFTGRSNDGLPGMVGSFRILSGVRRMRRANSLSNYRSRSARKKIVMISLLVPTALFLFFGFATVIAMSFGRTQDADRSQTILCTFLLVSFMTSLTGCLSTALQSLFLSRDVRFLVSLPIPVRVIYFDRIGEVARGAVPGALFGMAICLGYVLGRAEDFSFVVFGFVAVGLLSATAISLAAAITSVAIRIASPARIRQVLIGISLFLLAVTSAIWREYGSSAARAERHPIGQAALDFVPSGWAKEALIRAVGTQPATALPLVALQIGVLLLVSGIGASSFAVTLTGNIERTELTPARISRRRSSPVGRRLLAMVPRHLVHWVKREWILIGRDFSRVSAAILPIGSVSIWVLMSLIWTPVDGTSASAFWLTHAPVLILPWGISLGTTVFAFGSEGAGIDLLRSLPVRPSLLLWSKYLAYFIPILLVSGMLALFSVVVRSGNSRDVWLLFVMTAALTATFCAVDLSMAAVAPRFDRGHVQRSTGFVARMFAAFGGLLIGGVLVVGLVGSPLGGNRVLSELGVSRIQESTATWMALLATGVTVPFLLLFMATRNVARWMRSR